MKRWLNITMHTIKNTNYGMILWQELGSRLETTGLAKIYSESGMPFGKEIELLRRDQRALLYNNIFGFIDTSLVRSFNELNYDKN